MGPFLAWLAQVLGGTGAAATAATATAGAASALPAIDYAASAVAPVAAASSVPTLAQIVAPQAAMVGPYADAGEAMGVAPTGAVAPVVPADASGFHAPKQPHEIGTNRKHQAGTPSIPIPASLNQTLMATLTGQPPRANVPLSYLTSGPPVAAPTAPSAPVPTMSPYDVPEATLSDSDAPVGSPGWLTPRHRFELQMAGLRPGDLPPDQLQATLMRARMGALASVISGGPKGALGAFASYGTAGAGGLAAQRRRTFEDVMDQQMQVETDPTKLLYQKISKSLGKYVKPPDPSYVEGTVGGSTPGSSQTILADKDHPGQYTTVGPEKLPRPSTAGQRQRLQFVTKKMPDGSTVQGVQNLDTGAFTPGGAAVPPRSRPSDERDRLMTGVANGTFQPGSDEYKKLALIMGGDPIRMIMLQNIILNQARGGDSSRAPQPYFQGN